MRVTQKVMVVIAFVLLMTLAIPVAKAQVPQMAPMLPEKQKELPPGTGFIPPRMNLSHLTGKRMPKMFKILQLPAQCDWRIYGVTPVKSQGNCGSCYAFASIANFESKVLIDSMETFDFSENNAKECNWYDTSCDGGNYKKMASWFSQKGTVLESCDPYVASDVSCDCTCPYVITLLDWRIISGSNVADTDVLKSYIYTYGPVYTTLYAGDDDDPTWKNEFRQYDGSYTLHNTIPDTLDNNHAVLIVGWDDSFSHAGGTGGWIVKNSWGTNWGGTCGYGSERGYCTIAYGSANIGEHSSYMHDWQDYDRSGGILYYDEGDWSNNYGYPNDQTAWGLCKFVPSSPCSLTRVEFWTNDATTDVDVRIYDDFNGYSLNNLLASKLNNSYDEAGYHSVAFDSPFERTAGDDIYAVIKFTNLNYTYPVATDDEGPNETKTTYLSQSGNNGSWYDLGTNKSNDIAIRVRITGLPTLTVTSPNGDENWAVESNQTITWETVGSIPEVKIEYSTDGGNNWTNIISATPNDGSHPWIVPNISSTNCLIRISNASDDDPWDASDASFTLSDQTSPSQVTNLQATSTDTSIILTWSPATDNIGVHQYLIYCGTTSGFTLGEPIATTTDTTYSHLETVPGVDYYYRVSAVDSSGNEGEYSTEVEATISTGIKTENFSELPESFLLMQNYPNPFNTETEIKYFLPKTTKVELLVYDLLGKKVATLVDQKQTAGYQTVSWDASPFSSGIYIYRLSVKSHTQARKMILLK